MNKLFKVELSLKIIIISPNDNISSLFKDLEFKYK